MALMIPLGKVFGQLGADCCSSLVLKAGVPELHCCWQVFHSLLSSSCFVGDCNETPVVCYHRVVKLKGCPCWFPPFEKLAFETRPGALGNLIEALQGVAIPLVLWLVLRNLKKRRELLKTLGVPSPFFPGILLSRKPPDFQGKRLVFGKNDG